MAKQQHASTASGLTAQNADRHSLYELSVQDPEQAICFIDGIFSKRNERIPLSLREDFCGTAWMCAEWIREGEERTAVGIDLDPEVLQWGREHNIVPLQDEAARVRLLQRNVLESTGGHYDVTVAFNFSYCALMKRAEMLRYCRGVLEELEPGGVFLMDIHGGSELTAEGEEETQHEGFRYVWDQRPFDAINGTSTRHIHFKFPDGSELNQAFSYYWRLWSLQELQDILSEVGFSEIEVYWEGSTQDGSGNGVFEKSTEATQEESWIAYVAAWKGRA